MKRRGKKPKRKIWIIAAAVGAPLALLGVGIAFSQTPVKTKASAAERDALLMEQLEQDRLRERLRAALNEAMDQPYGAWGDNPVPGSLLDADGAIGRSVSDIKRARRREGLIGSPEDGRDSLLSTPIPDPLPREVTGID